MTVWQTVLVFVVIPVAGLVVLAALTIGPSATRSPRYRVGRPWGYEPVWYIARPDASRPERAQLSGGGPASGPASVLDADTGTARGGASGEW